MELGLAGKTVLVTGASRGIGAAIASGFAAEGVDRIHVTSRSKDGLAALAHSIVSTTGVEVVPHALDLGLVEAREELFADVGVVDILVNNAGAIPPGPLDSADLSTWRTSWELKMWGYIDLTQRYLAAMEGAGGVIINNIGISGERPDSKYVAGSTANAGLMGFTRAVGSTSMDRGVRVVAVNPGPVETDRLISALKSRARDEDGDESRWRQYTQGYPGGRIARPGEVADLVVFLASARSSYISGCVVTLDGGFASRGTAF